MATQADSEKKQKSKPVITPPPKKQTQKKETEKKTTKQSIEKKADQPPQNLLSEVMEARNRWLEIIEKKNIGTKVFKNKLSKRTQKKILYLIPSPNTWLTEIRSQYIDLHKRLSKFKKENKSVSRNLWLPTIINNAEQVTIRIYEARSSRKVSIATAKKFAEKTELADKKLNEMTDNQEFIIDYFTGRKYKLSVLRETGTKVYTFTEWALCICPDGKKPKFERIDVEYTPRNDNSRKLICEQNKNALFVKLP